MTNSPNERGTRPNVLLILADDLGYSDIGCYGGEIHTSHLDTLAEHGVRFTQFYNTARCSPSRASLLTGLHPHTTSVGILAKDDRPGGYAGSLNQAGPTIAEVLRDEGYRTGLSGKWHLSVNVTTPDESWPTRRGFDHFFGSLSGCGSYYQPPTLHRGETPVPASELSDPDWYYTDALADDAVDFVTADDERPFFLYLAFTAPHWPLHAQPEDIARYQETYQAGWDDLRAARLTRQRSLGILAENTTLSARDPHQPPWAQAADPDWEAGRMSVYAAQVDRMDRAIGRVLEALENRGELDDTIVVFLSDNGGCAEELPQDVGDDFTEHTELFNATTRDGRPVRFGNNPAIVPGPEDTYASYGQAWANLSNTPFRMYKRWVHEGGIATPLIIRWPGGGLDSGTFTRDPYQLTDFVPTLMDLTGVSHPGGSTFLPGVSAAPSLVGQPGPPHDLFWEHIGNAAARSGDLKVVKETHGPWELYNLDADRAESHDLAAEHPDVVADLTARWQRWADSVGVLPWDVTLEVYADRGLGEREASS